MKTKLKLAALALALSTISSQLSAAFAATTIDAAHKYAYGADIGWLNWVADTNHGAVVGEYVCSGYIYAANVGWITLGNGSPANQIQYQNNSAGDFGVNHDGAGHLTGYAYGANIGWINFEQTYGKPKVDLLTGKLSGYIYSANCGWISLSNATAFVRTDAIRQAPLAPNGLPIPWLLSYFGTTNVNASSDPTGKGMTVAQDYVAGTNPNDINSVLRITAAHFASGGTNVTLTWNSVPTRLYYIQKNLDLGLPQWTDSGLGSLSPSLGISTTKTFMDVSAPDRFYRVQALLPEVRQP